MNLSMHGVSERGIDGALPRHRILRTEGLGYDEHAKVPTAGRRAGVPGVSRALVLDNEMLRRKSVAQSRLDPVHSVHVAPA